MGKDISIVIVNYRVKNLLERCLTSISESRDGSSCEIIVVDNNSKDGSVELLKQNFPEVKLIENQQNRGFSFACNQGVEKSSGRYVLLLNPDTIFPETGLKKVLDFMDSNPEAGICGPKMVDLRGNLLYSCRSFPSFLTSISSSQSFLFRLFPRNPLSGRYLLKDLNHSRIQEVDWVSGSCLLARKKMLERIGLLDESYFIYVEDVDLCYRAHKAGWRIFYLPEVTFVHQVGQSTSQNKLKSRLEHHKSMWIFFKKHFQPNPLVKVFVFFGILARLIFVSLSFIIYRKGKRS
jgi:GT2 family glycosyltransferase